MNNVLKGLTALSALAGLSACGNDKESQDLDYVEVLNKCETVLTKKLANSGDDTVIREVRDCGDNNGAAIITHNVSRNRANSSIVSEITNIPYSDTTFYPLNNSAAAKLRRPEL